MRRYIEVAVLVGVLVFFGVLLFANTAAIRYEEPQNTNELKSEYLDYIQENVIIKPYVPPVLPPAPKPTPTYTTPIRAPHPGNEETIRRWLETQSWKGQVGSPLASHASQIAASPYWSAILAICYLEQNHCVRAPHNNYWGLGPGIQYATLEDGINAINAFLAKAERNNRTTLESFKGWYCQSACTSWYPVIRKVKIELESL